MAHWTVVRTHPNCENVAVHNLERQSFEYYQPKILERVVRKNKIQNVESPLFPCYLFVKVVDRWRSLQYTYGVASVLSNGSLPSIVQDSVIAGLRHREVNGFIQLPKKPRFEVGDQVTIKSGLFANQSALVERMPAKDRQRVLLELLSNKIKVLVEEDDIETV